VDIHDHRPVPLAVMAALSSRISDRGHAASRRLRSRVLEVSRQLNPAWSRAFCGPASRPAIQRWRLEIAHARGSQHAGDPSRVAKVVAGAEQLASTDNLTTPGETKAWENADARITRSAVCSIGPEHIHMARYVTTSMLTHLRAVARRFWFW